MKNNRARLQKIERLLIQDDMTVYLSHHLDDDIPKGMFGKLTTGQDLIVLSKKEYEAEISTCHNLISVGKYHEKQ